MTGFGGWLFGPAVEMLRASKAVIAPFLFASITLLGVTLLPNSADAAVLISVVQQGNDLVASGSGSLDTTDLTFLGTGGGFGENFDPSYAIVRLGSISSSNVMDSVFSGNISGPSSFGTINLFEVPTSGSGDQFGIFGNGVDIFAPLNYVSGTNLSATDTWSNATLNSLGLTPGTYVYTWGTGPDADSLTVQIGAVAAVPEPSTWATMLLGFAGVGFMAYRKKSKPALMAA
jgi:hypothetical protein